MARFGGVSGALGRQNAIRTPKRTASTAAALMIGVALVGFIMTFAASAKASINDAVDRDFHGNFVLDTGTYGIGGVSHQLSADLADRPEFSAVTASRAATASVDGDVTELNSFDAATLTSVFDIEPQQGDVAAFDVHGIAVEDSFATKHGLTMGSQVPAHVRRRHDHVDRRGDLRRQHMDGIGVRRPRRAEPARHRSARRQGCTWSSRRDQAMQQPRRSSTRRSEVPERRVQDRAEFKRRRPATSTRC